VLVEIEDVGRLLHLAVDLRLVHFGQPQSERHVLAHRHVRVQRIALEHHRDVAILGLDVVDHLAVDGDGAAANLFEAGQHAQQRRLAAARRTHQHHEFAIFDVERDPVNNLRVAECLLDAFKRD